MMEMLGGMEGVRAAVQLGWDCLRSGNYSCIIGYAGALYAAAVVGTFLWSRLTAPGFNPKGKHVFITGGSAGLGLSFALLSAKAGAKVTIVARSRQKLEAAKETIQAACGTEASVHCFTCDVTDPLQMEKTVAAANSVQGRVTDYVICNAGLSIPGYFEDQDISVFRKTMDVNYMGVVHTVKAALPHMIAADNRGTFVLVSSAAAFVSFIGYGSYSPTKYAVRALAEALRNELKRYKMTVHSFYPANIDTPGFEEENKTKPAETFEIEGAASTMSSDAVAACLARGIAAGNYAITNDLPCEVMRIYCNGMAPRPNTLFELALLPFFGIFQFFFVLFMDHVVVSQAKRIKKSK